MSELQLLLISLLPSLGTLIGIAFLTLKIVFKFGDLRKEVRDDNAVKALKPENKALQAMVRATQEQLAEATVQLQKVVKIIVDNGYKQDLIIMRLNEVVNGDDRTDE